MIYHYYATKEQDGILQEMDGIYSSESPIVSYEDYQDLKKVIADHCGISTYRLVIRSLTRLPEE